MIWARPSDLNSTLFSAEPSVVKTDDAKWMLDDPRVNFAISSRGMATGVDHVGIQVEDRDELGELSARLKAAGQTTFDEESTTCCYAQSDKSWVSDPSGLRWETFFTFGEATTYGEETKSTVRPAAKSQRCRFSSQKPLGQRTGRCRKRWAGMLRYGEPLTREPWGGMSSWAKFSEYAATYQDVAGLNVVVRRWLVVAHAGLPAAAFKGPGPS
jgi:hypothetical protein